MAEDKKQDDQEDDDSQSVFSQAILAYRDVEVAKRAQPRLVQGIQQTQIPLSRNNAAPFFGAGSVGSTRVASGSNMAIYAGLGLMAIMGVIFFKKVK